MWPEDDPTGTLASDAPEDEETGDPYEDCDVCLRCGLCMTCDGPCDCTKDGDP